MQTQTPIKYILPTLTANDKALEPASKCVLIDWCLATLYRVLFVRLLCKVV